MLIHNTVTRYFHAIIHNYIDVIDSFVFPLARFLLALGIRRVGQSAAKLIAERFNTLEALRADLDSGSGKMLLSFTGK